jgi:hypothetical protein
MQTAFRRFDDLFDPEKSSTQWLTMSHTRRPRRFNPTDPNNRVTEHWGKRRQVDTIWMRPSQKMGFDGPRAERGSEALMI